MARLLRKPWHLRCLARGRPAPVSVAGALGALLLTSLALTATACGPQVAPGLARLHLCTSDEGPADAYCGTLDVFEDRAAAAGRRIPLAIVVLPASSDEYRADPLFFLAGGPGQGAATMAPLIQAAFQRVQRHRDIVLVDQRGTGRSHPLDCETDDNSLRDLFADDDAQIARLRECLASYDADVRLYTTPLAMDDLEDVRAHLGYESINLYGASYGTRAALVYLRQHGHRVRSVVLDGVAPTDMRIPLFTARDAGRALDLLLAECAGDARCGAAFPNLRSRVAALLARLERTPARVALTHPRTGERGTVLVTARIVAGTLFSALYAPATGTLVPLLVEQAERDHFEPLVALALASDADNLSLGMQLSVLCSEDAGRVDEQALEDETRGLMFGRHLMAGQLRACEMWPRGALPADYFAPVSSPVPALILSGEIDPVTPPAWGETVARSLPNSRHVTAPATGHGVATSACGIRLVDDFLERATARDLDVSCLKGNQRPPFFLTPSGPLPPPEAREARP